MSSAGLSPKDPNQRTKNNEKIIMLLAVLSAAALSSCTEATTVKNNIQKEPTISATTAA